VAHNAGFDIAFLDAELNRAAKPAIAAERVVDTLVLAQRKHPGGHNTLDDLCARYDVDRSHRSKHGALLDAELRSKCISAACRFSATSWHSPNTARRNGWTTHESGRGRHHSQARAQPT
jgi:DNA polymerase III alpha subunit (gram-positive type)